MSIVFNYVTTEKCGLIILLMTGFIPNSHSLPISINPCPSESTEEIASKIRKEILLEKDKSLSLCMELEREKKRCKELESCISFLLMLKASNLSDPRCKPASTLELPQKRMKSTEAICSPDVINAS